MRRMGLQDPARKPCIRVTIPPQSALDTETRHILLVKLRHATGQIMIVTKRSVCCTQDFNGIINGVYIWHSAMRRLRNPTSYVA